MKFMLLIMPRIHTIANATPIGPVMSIWPPSGLVIVSGVAPSATARTATAI